MKLWHRISLIIAFVAIFIAGFSQFIFSTQLESSLKEEDSRWSASLSEVLAAAIMRDTLEGKTYNASKLLKRIKSQNDGIHYMLVVDFNSKVFASTFDKVPEFLIEKDHTTCKPGDLNSYNYNRKQITDITNPLVNNLNAHVHLGIRNDELLDSVADSEISVLVAVLTVSLSGIFFGGLMGRRTSQPIEQLTNALKTYGRKESLDNISLSGNTIETNELITSFKEMVAQRSRDEKEIFDYRNKLEQLVQVRTLELEKEVEEHKKTEIELEAAKVEAEKANQAKSTFLSQMSHELRTPMNAILGYAQILELELPKNTELHDSAREIKQAGNHLLQLINDVLDLSRIESGKLLYTIEPVIWADIIEESMRLVQSHSEEMQVALTFRSSLTPDQNVRADRLRLKQVTLNLLSNAVKYNIRGGRVEIELKQNASGYITLTVADTGVGISESNKDSVFEPFNRLAFRNSEIEGAGIGLFICKRLITEMDGELYFTSSDGNGSQFHVTLPIYDYDAEDAMII